MNNFEKQCNEVQELTCLIVNTLEQDEFEKANVLLEKRLTVLKQLDEYVNSSDSFDILLPTYKDFLQEVQRHDNTQLNLLLAEKSKIKAQSLKQKKTKTALSAYNSVQLS